MICVSCMEKDIQKAVQIVSQYPLVELRLDLIDQGDDYLQKVMSAKSQVIITFRATQDDKTRLQKLKKYLELGADYIDLEVEASDIYKEELIALAKQYKTKVIISYHNFEKTPPRRELEQVKTWCFDSGADIAKIACKVNNPRDNADLLSLYTDERPLIVVGMGELGRITRVAADKLGAPFTFASIDANQLTAEGQFSEKELKKLLELI